MSQLWAEGGVMSILDANGAIACAECGRQARAVRDRLKAENAKLREENERFIIKLNAEHIARQNAESENAKLRELVRDMARAWWACDNERCPHGSSCDAAVSEGKLADCEMERRMAELGIEVGE